MAEFHPENELLPHTIDLYARVKPDTLYAEYPRSSMSYEDGYLLITYRAFANAINGAAWWLTKKFGPGQGEVLAYIGPNDIRYPALVMGAVKAGYCMFLTSPRNSVAAHESLLRALNCTKVLVTTPRPPSMANLMSVDIPLGVYEAPSVEQLLAHEHAHFEYSKTYPDSGDRLVAIHTSGSTGIPKPIIWTLETANRHMRMVALNPPEGFEDQHRWSRGKRLFLTLPPFHAAGLATILFIGVPAGMTIIAPTSGGLPTAAALVEARKQTPFEVALVVPSIIHELAQRPSLLDYCSQHLEYLMYAGGDLPQAVGNAVASKIKLVNQYGATEVGMLSAIHSLTNQDLRHDWRYIHFHPDLGAKLRPVMEDEYELVMVHSSDCEPRQMHSTIFGPRDYSTRDLWVRHPDPAKSDLWRWSSRADDVIVFLNGEKTNPVSMEQHIIASNHDVAAVVVAGSQRFQASLIIELSGDTVDMNPSERAASIEKIWPSIEEANSTCPAHARISRTHILFTTPDKPMLRAGKGTVQRAGTLALYSAELDALYTSADQLATQQDGETSGPGRVSDLQQVTSFIRQSISTITGWSEDELSTDNFFTIGLDSLQIITAARRIKRGLDLPSFTPNLIYLNPSVSGLAQATLQLIENDAVSQEETKEALLAERDALLREFTDQINAQPANTLSSTRTDPNSHVVVLTGSTGALGTYILNTLLQDPSVTHVHCLNRKQDSATIQQQKNTFYHLPKTDPSRVTFWHTDLSRPDLGLPPSSLQTIQKATTIIHNAWTVNFNIPLSAFTPDLQGLTNLINLTLSSSTTPNLFFISSISSIMNHKTPSSTTPEELITTTNPTINSYAESKYIAEHILSHARSRTNASFAFARVGQIAGAANEPGQWNPNEWFPSLVRSSLQVRALPRSLGPTLGRVDWVPVDLLAGVLVDLALGEGESARGSDGDGGIEVYHPLNLCPTTWDDVRGVVGDMLSLRVGGIEVVSLAEWIGLIRGDIEGGEGDLRVLLERNPAAKLLGFFEGVVAEDGALDNRLETERTAERSEKLRNIGGIQDDWVRKWVSEWLLPLDG